MAGSRETSKEQLQERILDEAFAVFAENGYTKAKLSDIAQRAGVATGLVNKYFTSKENLFTAIITHRVLGALFRGTANLEMDDALDLFLDGIKNFILADRIQAEFSRMLVSSKDLPFESLERFADTFASEPLVQKIAEAQRRGLLPVTESAIGLLFGLYKGTIILTRWYKELGLVMPENDSLLFIIAYDRKALRESRPSYFALHTEGASSSTFKTNLQEN